MASPGGRVKAKAIERLAAFPYAIHYAVAECVGVVGLMSWKNWSRRSGLNGRPAVYEWEQDDFEKARCFKWFPRFLFEYRGFGTFQQLYW